MNLEDYKKRFAWAREHMEKPLPPADLGSVTATKVSHYMPGHAPKSPEKSREKYPKKKFAR